MVVFLFAGGHLLIIITTRTGEVFLVNSSQVSVNGTRHNYHEIKFYKWVLENLQGAIECFRKVFFHSNL